MKQSKPNSRQFFYLLAFILIVILLGSASYLQLHKGINPCPLCLLQRFVFAILGVIFVFGVASSLKGFSRWMVGLFSTFFSLVGIAIAGRQVWLQHLPEKAGPNCEASLQYLLKALPFDQAIQKVFQGGTHCSEVGWVFLHLSLAEWSLICFTLFLFFSLWQAFRD